MIVPAINDSTTESVCYFKYQSKLRNKRELWKPTFREPLRFFSKNWSSSPWPYSGNTATFRPTPKPVPRANKTWRNRFLVSVATTQPLSVSHHLLPHNLKPSENSNILLLRATMCGTDYWKPPSWSPATEACDWRDVQTGALTVASWMWKVALRSWILAMATGR